ncbi:DUF262 domain-containing protein [Stigmatella sp. ncwal1]|uniref:DUF262 domain-containing protein n=1 Tax=Stigmatella ashevillensis TaxID=2995309 RepID=A0ABT5DHA5_9BACT|nr:DUF262 domain-containing protein [Stigmatella ashevillena]MDC0712464.1 DUF262 domain-containing protein [Stigmatella ashevillena]
MPTELETKTFSVSALLDAIRKGRVRIPHFQRGFRWNDEDRRLLFDSLQSGFPIGTLLLARGEAPAAHIMLGGFAANVPQTPDALWVVDGQQRLVTLAMALLEDHSGAYRPLFFDLEANRFVTGPRRRSAPPYWVPTHVLSSSAVLNKWLRETAISAEMSDRADAIASRLREYAVPAYLIPYDGQNDQLLQEIFARVNQRGRALEKHEVFQALHSSVMGGKGPIDRVRDELVQLGFGELDGSQIEKAAIAVAGGDPRKPLQDQVNGKPVAELLERTSKSLALTIESLSGDAGVPHVSWLPYAGVIPALARFLSLHPAPHPRNRELLVRWFWRGTLTREHRTDNYLDLPKWRAIDEDEHGSVQRLLKLLSPVTEEDLPSALQPLVGGRSARRSTEYISLASLEPKVLVGEALGKDVPLASLIERQHGFFEVESLPGSDRTIASILLHPTDIPLDPFLLTGMAEPLLASHGLDGPSLRAWATGDTQVFVSLRSAQLLTHLRRFLTDAAGLHSSDQDRQPLEAYFEEEGA